MNLDLNQTIDSVLQWDFSITHSGQTHPTRPLTMGEMYRLSGLTDQSDLASALAAVKSATPGPAAQSAAEQLVSAVAKANVISQVARIFAEPIETIRPWLENFRSEHLSATIHAVIEYMKQVASKNSLAIASKLKEAMATTSGAPSGSSTPR